MLLAAIIFIASLGAFLNFIAHYPAPLGAIVVPTDYPTIQEAIDHAPPDSTIYVRNGIYNELLTIDKPLTLTGENPQKTIIKGHIQRFTTLVTITIQANNVIISNFNITGSNRGIDMYDNCSNCQITNNNIQDVDMGIGVNGKNNTVARNNVTSGLTWGINCYGNNSLISENHIENFKSGIYVRANNVTIEKNTITNCSKYAYEDDSSAGIILALGGTYNVHENILKNQKAGILYEGASQSAVYNNTISQNIVGVNLFNYFFSNTTSGGRNNIFFSNNLIDNQVQVLIDTATSVVSDLFNGTDVVAWDNGFVGNYWSDYPIRYPNATQNSTTATYNTPYTIDANNKDNHPQISPEQPH